METKITTFSNAMSFIEYSISFSQFSMITFPNNYVMNRKKNKLKHLYSNPTISLYDFDVRILMVLTEFDNVHSYWK